MMGWTLGRRGFGALAASLAAGGAAAQQAGNLSFMSFTFAEDAGRAPVQRLLDGFRAESGVSVEPIGSAWGDVQRNLLLRQRSRTLPSSAQLSERWLPALASLPEIVDLGALVGRATLADAIAPEVLAMGEARGRQLAIPLITGSIGMIANREVLARAGIERVPVTLAEFRAALVAVRDRVPNSAPFAMATKNVNSIPLDATIWIWAHGGRLVDEEGRVLIDSPETLSAIETMVGYMRDRLVAPELDRPDSRRLFAQGSAAFYIDAPQARQFIRTFSGRGEAADAFTLPMRTPVRAAGAVPNSIAWGHLVVLFQGAATQGPESPGARWIRHLISEPVQTSFPLALSALPATRAARAAPAIAGDPYFNAWAAATGTPLNGELGIHANAPELNTILSEELQAAMLGQKPARAALTAMRTRMEASMARRG
jgi:multiple sugar transport system substrate-binding protein